MFFGDFNIVTVVRFTRLFREADLIQTVARWREFRVVFVDVREGPRHRTGQALPRSRRWRRFAFGGRRENDPRRQIADGCRVQEPAVVYGYREYITVNTGILVENDLDVVA